MIAKVSLRRYRLVGLRDRIAHLHTYTEFLFFAFSLFSHHYLTTTRGYILSTPKGRAEYPPLLSGGGGWDVRGKNDEGSKKIKKREKGKEGEIGKETEGRNGQKRKKRDFCEEKI